jgi:membrane protease YdiL (CAAX protease family)
MAVTIARNKIFLFLILTLALSAWPYISMVRSGTMIDLMVLALMWAPGIAAIVTQFVSEGTLKGLGWRWGKPRYLLISFLIPLVACLVVYGLSWAVGIVPFGGAELVDVTAQATGLQLSLPLAIVATVAALFLPSLFTASGEEIGWRGLLLPELARRTTFTRAALISGVIWAIYHYPLVFFADYRSTAPLWFVVPMFTVSILSVSLFAAWLRLKSGSLWTGAILHASHNLFVQAVFDVLTLDFGLAPYITTEFGAGLALVYALLAFTFWRRRGEVAYHAQVDSSS